MLLWRVDELLEAKGWTIAELAREADLDEKTVRAIVSGRAKRVDLRTIGRLCSALGVLPGALWEMRAVDRWHATRGLAGQATPEEIAEALAGWPNAPDPGLERATRPT